MRRLMISLRVVGATAAIYTPVQAQNRRNQGLPKAVWSLATIGTVKGNISVRVSNVGFISADSKTNETHRIR